jgi:hypothetical protein
MNGELKYKYVAYTAYYNNEGEENEMGGACSTNGVEEERV